MFRMGRTTSLIWGININTNGTIIKVQNQEEDLKKVPALAGIRNKIYEKGLW